MLPLIVSFYTNDWEYPIHAARLKRECTALGLDYHIECLPTTGSYLKNTCMKPSFIRKCLDFGRPILWVDVDGSILKVPEFFDGLDADFAARRMVATRQRTWHVGTMFFNPTSETVRFLDAWIEKTGECSDESSLEAAFRESGQYLITSNIPAEYFELALGCYKPTDKTVIFHRISTSESKRSQKKFFEDYERTVI